MVTSDYYAVVKRGWFRERELRCFGKARSAVIWGLEYQKKHPKAKLAVVYTYRIKETI